MKENIISRNAIPIFLVPVIMTALVFFSGCVSVTNTSHHLSAEKEKITYKYRIADWYNFKHAACSITFDDGTLDQYCVAFPELEKRNLKATFFIITGSRDTGIWHEGRIERRLFSWKQAKEMAFSGHEIASHSRTHADLTNTQNDITEELKASKHEILHHIPAYQKRGITFSWPYWRNNNKLQKIAGRYYIGARGGGGDVRFYPKRYGGIPEKTPPNFYQINAMSVTERYGADQMKNLCDITYNAGGWFLTCFHGIDDGKIPKNAVGWDPLLLQHFIAALDYIKNKKYWIGTFGEVIRYIHERNQAIVTINSKDRNSIRFSVEDGLDDTVYYMPLTIEITVPPHWQKVKIYRNNSYVYSTTVKKGKVICNISPDGSMIRMLSY